MLVVSKKKKSSNLKNRYFVGFDLKVDLICHVMLVSNFSFGFVSYFYQINFDCVCVYKVNIVRVKLSLFKVVFIQNCVYISKYVSLASSQRSGLPFRE